MRDLGAARFMRQCTGLLVALLAFGGTAHAVDIKIASVAPDGSRWMQQMRAGAEEVSARTGGRVNIKFYPGGVMGNDAQVLRKIRIGQLQGLQQGDGRDARLALRETIEDRLEQVPDALVRAIVDIEDVERLLPRVAAMGFDTLYFPPIHPIGEEKRKGRNNSLTAQPDDPGSPWAGSPPARRRRAPAGRRGALPRLGAGAAPGARAAGGRRGDAGARARA